VKNLLNDVIGHFLAALAICCSVEVHRFSKGENQKRSSAAASYCQMSLSVKENVRQVSHRFRNTFAVHLLMMGVPLETVSLLLGHQNISTTENCYAAFSRCTWPERKRWYVRFGI
jgi:site-specific recombinase XerC